MALTTVAIAKAKTRSKSYKLSDAQGLYLLVHSNGSKYWRLKYRVAGKEKLLAVGTYPAVTLAVARRVRDEAKQRLAAGVDPVQQRRDQKRRVLFDSVNTFAAVAKEWIEAQRGRWTDRHADKVTESLANNAFPLLGSRPVAEIETLELLNTLRIIEKRGALEVASRVAQRCASVLRYAVQTGRIKSNPALDLKGALKTRKAQHRAALSAAELPEFLRKLADYDGYIQTRYALEILMLTFVRPGELRGARWSEVDFEKHEWRIPAERMKMREEHIVPLSSQAVAALKAAHDLSKDSEFVFPSPRNSRKTMSENSLLFAMYRMGYHSRATAHGFRATASTILNEMGFDADVIERQLAHAERNKVRAAYHRSQYLSERRAMMQHWADYLDARKSGQEKVVAGRFGKAA